jgi:outer membrane protein assembly factor BamB
METLHWLKLPPKRLSFKSLAAFAMAVFVIVAPASAQDLRSSRFTPGMTLVGPKPATMTKDDDAHKDSETKFPGGASLKTDRELERLLDRASQFAQNKRFDLASVLWQRILDESGDVLRSGDGRFYTALANEVESLLKAMPEEARVVYRIKADGEAQALMAQAQLENTESNLGRIVRHYFMSSLGDDAAFQLACLALDRQDFVGARRLLERALFEHPDSSLPRGAVLVRHAVAAARSGDLETARKSLADSRRSADLEDLDLLSKVEDLIAVAANAESSIGSLEAGEWPMPWGAPDRKALMNSLPKEFTSSTLTDYWSRSLLGDATPSLISQLDQSNPFGRAGVARAGIYTTGRISRTRIMGGPAGLVVDPRSGQTPSQVENWKRANWLPATQLAFHSGSMILRTRFNIESWDTSNLDSKSSWNSAWLNTYDFDAMTQSLLQMGPGDPSTPMGTDGVRGFGDRIHGMTSVIGGVVYTIEGRRFTNNGSIPQAEQRQVQWGVVPRRARTNFLSAYDAATGKSLWNRPASDDPSSTQDVGFLAAPTPCGELLLVPVTDAGTVYLYALNPQTGATAWKSYLCDEPPGGSSPWTPVTISVEGADAYVVCGAGVVFSIDGLSGAIRWAVRYDRDSLRAARTQQNYGAVQGRFKAPGWDDDVAAPIGKALVIFSSDQNKDGESQLFAIDRLTGEFLWQSPRISPFNTDASYFLGVWKRGVLVAGRNVVRMYDAVSGRLLWDKELKQSLGRGAVTADAIYVPDRDSVVILDPETGKERNQVGVRLSTGDPVGNLYVDGKQIWVANHDRVYALTNLDLRLEELATKIEAGDTSARIARIHLLARLDRAADTFADIEAIFRTQVSSDTAKAHDTLFSFIRELRLVSLKPIETLELLKRNQLESDISTSQPAHLKYRATRDDIAMSAINQLALGRPTGALDGVLDSRKLFSSPHMALAASSAVARVATKGDLPKLIALFEGKDDDAKQLVVKALAQHGDAEVFMKLEAAANTSSDSLRHAIAHELTCNGNARGLNLLVDLLASADPNVRVRSHSDLCWVTSRFAPLTPISDQAALADEQQRWRTVLADSKLVLKTPLPALQPKLGRVLVCNAASGRILELDQDLKDRWSIDAPGALRCLGLPNGHRLSTSQQNTAAFMHEYDAQGAMIKSISLRGMADSLMRLESGSTLMAMNQLNQVVEVDEEGKIVWEISIVGQPYDAQRLPGGRTLVALRQANRVVEIDEKGKVVWQASNLSQPTSCRRLPDGNTLIALQGAGMVIEVDAKSKVVWSAKGLKSPRLIERLIDGRTLVTDSTGLHVLDAEGKIVASRADLSGLSGLSAY